MFKDLPVTAEGIFVMERKLSLKRVKTKELVSGRIISSDARKSKHPPKD
jgi:hypothetical protein